MAKMPYPLKLTELLPLWNVSKLWTDVYAIFWRPQEESIRFWWRCFFDIAFTSAIS